MRARLFLMIVVCAMLSRTAIADESAKDLYQRAMAQYALSNYGDAALIFEKVFAIKPDPAILYNAAQAHRLAGNKQRALDLYSNYLRVYGDHTDNRVEVQKHIDNLRAALEHDHTASNQPPVTLKNPPPPKPVDTVVIEQPPPREHRVKPWVWGVVAGGVVVVGAVIAVGVVVGTRGSKDPADVLGTAKGN